MKKIKAQKFLSFTLAIMMMFGLLAGVSVSANDVPVLYETTSNTNDAASIELSSDSISAQDTQALDEWLKEVAVSAQDTQALDEWSEEVSVTTNNAQTLDDGWVDNTYDENSERLSSELTAQYNSYSSYESYSSNGSNGKFIASVEPPAAGSIPISTRTQLEAIKNNLSGKYHLTNDIDLSGAEWVPIGTGSGYNSFTGTFDGQRYVIKNLKIGTATNPKEIQYAGLFGYTSGATIKNVGLEGTYINISSSTTNYAGGILGFSGYSGSVTLNNCYNTGSVSAYSDSSFSYVGGICGRGYSSVTLNNCYNTGSVSASSGSYAETGGICGSGDSSVTISNCYNTGSVSASSASLPEAGGICGYGSATISNCYNTGSVSASASSSTTTYAGGIFGAPSYSGSVTVNNCYNTGNIFASSVSYSSSYAAGICGGVSYEGSVTLSNCYNTGNISISASSYSSTGGICARGDSGSVSISNCYWNSDSEQKMNNSSVVSKKGVGKGTDTTKSLTTAQMKQQSSFAGWNFTNVWGSTSNTNNGYPYLRVFDSSSTADTYGGECGVNLTWTLDPVTGVLAISGTGAMTNWQWFGTSYYAPWNSYRADIKTVTLSNGVTSIGNSAFYYCSNLTSITIPNNLTYIGDDAFLGCYSLESIAIPPNVTFIGEWAFRRCSSLLSTKIPYGVTSIKNNTFSYCDRLESVTIPDSVTSIGNEAFRYCDSLESITIPNSVTSIGNEVFGDCENLSVANFKHLNANNITLGNNVFQNAAYNFKIIYPKNSSGFTTPWNGYPAYPDNCEPITTYTITYNANGGTGVPSDQTKTHGVALTLSWTEPKKTNYNFLGWSTNPSAITATYSAGGSYTANAAVTLYAVWQASSAQTYTIKYDANGGTSKPSDQTKTYGVTLTLSWTKPTKTGYAFLGWSTSSTATTATYTEGSSFTTNANTTLYAVWKAETYTIKYNANGGTGAPSDQTKTYGVTLTLSSTKPTRTNYNFLGWSTSQTATSATYSASGSYTANAAATLYAVWQAAPSQKDNTMIFGQDNWTFAQASNLFKSDYWLDASFYTNLTNKLSNTEKTAVNKMRYSGWGGSCYGMAVTEILAKMSIFNIPNWESGKTNLSKLTKTKGDKSETIINYHMLLQNTTKIQQAITNTIYYTAESTKVQTLVNKCSEVKNGGAPVLLCYFGPGWGGHAVVAYGVEYASYTKNGVTYGGRILISDPNSAKFNEDDCLYFNKNTYAWTIPRYNLRSAKGDYIGLVTNDLSLINHYGYFNGSIGMDDMDYIAILDFDSATSNYSVQKIRRAASGAWINAPTDEESDIKKFYDLRHIGDDGDDDSPSITKFALIDSESGYSVNLDKAEKFNLSLSYENSLLQIQADKGKSAKFEPNGFIELECTDSNYEMSMTFNERYYSLPWYMVTAKGQYEDKVSLTKINDGINNGIVMRGNNLTDVVVSVANSNSVLDVKFTATYNNTVYNEVLIHAIDDVTVGISIDTNGDGIYETIINEGDSELVEDFITSKDEEFKIEKIDGENIITISSGIEATTLSENLESSGKITIEKSVSDSKYIGTGSKVKLSDSDYELTVIVPGDLTGRGVPDIEDAKIFLESLVGNAELSETQRLALSAEAIIYENGSDIQKLRAFLNFLKME